MDEGSLSFVAGADMAVLDAFETLGFRLIALLHAITVSRNRGLRGTLAFSPAHLNLPPAAGIAPSRPEWNSTHSAQ